MPETSRERERVGGPDSRPRVNVAATPNGSDADASKNRVLERLTAPLRPCSVSKAAAPGKGGTGAKKSLVRERSGRGWIGAFNGRVATTVGMSGTNAGTAGDSILVRDRDAGETLFARAMNAGKVGVNSAG